MPRRVFALPYTGQRYSEIAALRWGEIDLGNTPCLRLFAAQTKDLDDRAIPLHPALADKLRAAKPLGAQNDALVFKAYPTLEMFYTDLKRAGIDRIDAAGRRVHLHALRKTFQTMGVQAGINQRAAQEFLGHSDANTTAKIYTHTPALGLSSEIQKLPWWEPEKALSSATVTFNAQNELIIEKLNDLVNLLKSTDCKGLDANTTAAAMAARHGFEP